MTARTAAVIGVDRGTVTVELADGSRCHVPVPADAAVERGSPVTIVDPGQASGLVYLLHALDGAVAAQRGTVDTVTVGSARDLARLSPRARALRR